jgi:hypothetical protein
MSHPKGTNLNGTRRSLNGQRISRINPMMRMIEGGRVKPELQILIERERVKPGPQDRIERERVNPGLQVARQGQAQSNG